MLNVRAACPCYVSIALSPVDPITSRPHTVYQQIHPCWRHKLMSLPPIEEGISLCSSRPFWAGWIPTRLAKTPPGDLVASLRGSCECRLFVDKLGLSRAGLPTEDQWGPACAPREAPSSAFAHQTFLGICSDHVVEMSGLCFKTDQHPHHVAKQHGVLWCPALVAFSENADTCLPAICDEKG